MEVCKTMTQDKDVQKAVKRTRMEAIKMLREADTDNRRIFELLRKYYSE